MQWSFPVKWLIFSVFFLGMFKLGRCQQVWGHKVYAWELSAGGMFVHNSVIDKRISSVPFDGTSPGILAQATYLGHHAMHQLSFQYLNGSLQPSISENDRVDQSIFQIAYSDTYPIYNSTSGLLSCRAGGSVQFLFANRNFYEFINDNYSFESLASLGAAGEIKYLFPGKGKKFYMTDQVYFPFLFLLSQPDFGNNSLHGNDLNQNSGVQQIFRNSNLTTLSECFQLKNFFSVGWNFGQRHSAVMGYTWNYYEIKGAQNVVQASHQLSLSYSYKL